MTPARREELGALAQALASAADTQQWLEYPSAPQMPTTLEEAYAVQDMAVALRADVPRGWKIGATSPDAMSVFQVSEPFCGRVFQNDIYASPATIHKTRADMLVLEAEFAFTMAADLPAIGRPYRRGEVVDAVAMLHPAIEYVQSRYRVRGRPHLLRSVADNAGQGALVIGQGITAWQELPLPQLAVRLVAEGRELASGSGAEVLGDPVNCLVWLVNSLSARGLGLKAGEVITTGTCTFPVEAQPNVPVVAQFEGLTEVSATLRTSVPPGT